MCRESVVEERGTSAARMRSCAAMEGVCACVCVLWWRGRLHPCSPRAVVFGVCYPSPTLEGAILLEEVMHPR